MPWTLEAAERDRRMVDDPWKAGDDRKDSEAQRDRDRILYSSAFRRLAEVTQVVSPSGSQVFHNRLTHTLKVAQIGWALAALLREGSRDLIAAAGGIDPNVVEAALMDWADDVAYSVHDMEDFYRAGLIPLHRLARPGHEQELFLDNALRRLRTKGWDPHRYSDEDLRRAFIALASSSPVVDAYTGTHRQRAGLRTFTSQLTSRFIQAVRFADAPTSEEDLLVIDPMRRMEVAMLKELTWEYVITNPALTTQQVGQRRAIRELFTTYMDAAASPGQRTLFPALFRDYLREVGDDRLQQARIVADLISGLTEEQALRLHRRFTGVDLGTVLDPLVT